MGMARNSGEVGGWALEVSPWCYVHTDHNHSLLGPLSGKIEGVDAGTGPPNEKTKFWERVEMSHPKRTKGFWTKGHAPGVTEHVHLCPVPKRPPVLHATFAYALPQHNQLSHRPSRAISAYVVRHRVL